ncbi:MAG: class II D-tagatose-bisphosphate aldolase, non-catalytic subunit [Chloroflexi bacterium]|nr:class II D-tagatose-bisphosphate aldolase, non-catalytic subunit [Chloroflexota bacterium]
MDLLAYTGLTPAGFEELIQGIAARMNFPSQSILLGGDHLGPFAWKDEPAAQAMAKSARMVQGYIRAGYRKIHLDASMACLDDEANLPLPKTVSAERAAQLCSLAEEASLDAPNLSPPVYVIGTEVPIPGGGQGSENLLQITRLEDATETIDLFHQAFARHALQSAWERVAALVVQPGVEFSENRLVEYDREKATGLSRFIEQIPGIVPEAHSTDYQRPEHLRQLVEDHFAILKVGPALTFAFREAVFVLARMEQEWLEHHGSARPSHLMDVVSQAMQRNPHYWNKYYRGNEGEIAFDRIYIPIDLTRLNRDPRAIQPRQ